MADMSLPPLTLLPLAEDADPEAHADPGEPHAWPTPALACYPSPSVPLEPEPCEILGLNGRVIAGRLTRFDPAARCLHVLAPPSRSPITLRFGQFRQLTLMNPLSPLASAPAADAQDVLAARPVVPYRITLRDGEPLTGSSLGPIEKPFGVFLFEPVDALGSLRRRFIPRAAYTQIELGAHIGELLVQQEATTRSEVDRTLQEQAKLRAQKVGDVLLVKKVLTPEQLDLALDQQSRMPMVRVGEALMALGFISQVQLDEALEQQAADRSLPLGELLVRKGAINRDDLQVALSRKMGYPFVDVLKFPVEAEALSRVPFPVARRLGALPLMQRGSRLVVALTDPTRGQDLEELEFVAQGSVVPVLARPDDLESAIARAYDRLGIGAWLPGEGLAMDQPPESNPRDASELLATLELQHSAEQRRSEEEPQIEQSDNSLVKLINQMILEAQSQGVSDIHIECQPGREKLRIRFRKDGLLRPYLELPHTYRAAMIARLKIMCDLDISERRKPQDGKINFAKFQPGARLELRLATIPTNNGLEDAVLRLLASTRPLPLAELGLSPANLEGVKSVMDRPYGMLLCVGPTGSGKTTTLHSAMGLINRPDRKIWTAEDPIEITQPGLRQVQVNPKIDWTFAKALRAFLRADPDVVMVGEIRDQETAQVAIEASLTGHLVLSTLHTNSAAETVTRLLDMGMDPFNFADALLGVLAQRLVRRWCTQCRQVREATPAEIDEWLDDYLHAFVGPEPVQTRDEVLAGWTARHARDGRLMFHYSPGCPACDQTGYRGRTAIHELMLVSRAVRRLIQTGARAEAILVAALAEGTRTLRQDGIEKVVAGLTSLDEVRASSNV